MILYFFLVSKENKNACSSYLYPYSSFVKGTEVYPPNLYPSAVSIKTKRGAIPWHCSLNVAPLSPWMDDLKQIEYPIFSGFPIKPDIIYNSSISLIISIFGDLSNLYNEA